MTDPLEALFSETNKTPKIPEIQETYAVGDYITCREWIMMRIVCILNEDTSNPTYGLWNHKKNFITWETLYTFKQQGLHKVRPDFKRWASIKSGDMIHTGIGDDRSYAAVIARVGDAVLISLTPASRKEKQKFNDIANQLEELTDGEVNLKEQIKLPQTTQEAYNTASDQWMTTEQLALMNWELIGEE